MKRNHMWKLEFLLEGLKSKSNTIKSVSTEFKEVEDAHQKGIGSGLGIANREIEEFIEKFDDLLLEMQCYMKEDVTFEMEEEEHV